MHEHAVALGDAARGERRRERRHVGVDLAPGPGALAPDEAGAVAGKRRAFCVSEMREVHHPPRHPRDAA